MGGKTGKINFSHLTKTRYLTQAKHVANPAGVKMSKSEQIRSIKAYRVSWETQKIQYLSSKNLQASWGGRKPTHKVFGLNAPSPVLSWGCIPTSSMAFGVKLLLLVHKPYFLIT